MLNGFLDNVPQGVTLNERASVMVHMGVPFSCKGAYSGAVRVLYSMWETDQLPPRFIAWMGEYDRVLVPCQHNVEVFSKYHHDVRYVPLGVDMNVWKPAQRQTNQRFRIHAGGSLWGRKGLDTVIEACKKLPFEHELHIKLAPHAKDHPSLEQFPNATFNREWLTLEQNVQWMRQADLFLAPSRGEGFGLIPLQAIACGIPTIITATSGQAQFAHLATGVVPHRKVPAQMHGYWDEANPSDLTELIIDHYRNHDHYKAQAATTVPKVDEFSWTRAADKLVANLPKGELLVPYAEDLVFEPFQPQVTFWVNRSVESSVNGKTKTFIPGTKYVDSEGVFRVLWDAGYVEMGAK